MLGSVVGRMRLLVALAAAMLVSGAMCSVVQAEVTHRFQFNFGGGSTPAGSFELPDAVAVDEASGDIWVADPNAAGEGAVYEFDSSGQYAGVEIDASSVPGGVWSLGTANGIAVDNSGGAGDGDIYVSQGYVVDKFDPNGKFISELKASDTPNPSFLPGGVAVDGSGDLYVADLYKKTEKTVDEFNEAGVFISKLSSLEITEPFRIAVDSHGDVYVANNFQDVVKVEPGGGATVVEIGNLVGVAVERSTGDVYVGEDTNGGPPANPVFEYSSSGSLLGAVGRAQNPAAGGIAVDEKTGDIYVVDSSGKVVDVYGPAVVVPDVVTGVASAVGQTSVVLNGTVNPDGVPVSGCEFEYGTSTTYEGSVPCEQAPGSIGSGSSLVAVSAMVKGLASGTEYHFRLVASNANGPNHGADATVETEAPAVVGPWAADVASTSATLSAEIDPLGLSTQYRLEYGTGLPYEHVLSGSVGEGHGPVLVSYHLQGLPSGVTYHYRLVVTSSLGTVEGSDHTFLTQAAGSEFALPDGRAWELVSPANKKGALIENNITIFNQPIQAASDGNAMAYMVTEPIGEGEMGHADAPEILAQRAASGWRNTDIAVHQETPAEGTSYVEFTHGTGAKYDLFSPDLSVGVLEENAQTSQSPEATKRTMYERNDSTGNYMPLVTSANVPVGTEFGEVEEQNPMQFETATPDLSHVVFGSSAALTSNALEKPDCPSEVGGPGGCADNLYEWAGGQLKLVSVLPDGKAVAGGVVGGEQHGEGGGAEGGMTARAISDDGRWVVWNDHYEPGSSKGLYLWDALTEKSVRIAGPNAQFEDMSVDGSRIFYLEGNESGFKLPSGGKLAGDLYMFDAETGTTTDLTPGHGAEEPNAGVQNAIMGASEDGSYVYFVAHAVLAPGAHGGADNLYVMHDGSAGWATTFIATLSSEDQRSWGTGDKYVDEKIAALEFVSSSVSSSGRYLAFMSDRSLTGYDNSDAVSGQPDEEVFLYDALQNKLVCTSCNPTGDRPVGQYDYYKAGEVDSPTFDPGGIWDTLSGTGDHWLAGFLPGWRELARNARDLAVHQPRYLSDSGRLFFDSPVALVPQDSNGQEDVYEYEPSGVGDCSTTGSTYSERSGGCVNLISSGTSSEESVFLDASENGDDAFFLTTAKLASGDYDTAYDIYDAHVCTAAEPCRSAPVAPPPCTSGDSCKPAPSPQPDIFGPPPSATFSGTGNVHPEIVKTPVKAESKPKAKKKRKPPRKKGNHKHKGKQSSRQSGVKRASGKGRK